MPGTTKVVLNLGVDKGNTNSLKAAAHRPGISSNVSQVVEISFDSEFTLVATLSEMAANGSKSSGSSLKASTQKASGITEETTLPTGTKYQVAVYQNDDFIKTQAFTVGGESSFDLEPGTYTFVTYASANPNISLPAPTAKLSEASLTNLSASDDVMLAVSPETSIVEGITNNLNVTLAHLFTEITVNFNSSVVGDATISAGSSFLPNYEKTGISLNGGGLLNPTGSTAGELSFTGSGAVYTSGPTLFLANTTAGVITLKGVSVAGSTPRDLTISNLIIEPKNRYVLNVNLVGKQSANLGGLDWSLGKLTFDRGTQTYRFASNSEPGDYYFPGYTVPKNMNEDLPEDQLNRSANLPVGVNGPEGDPCALVAPAGTWRLPYSEDIETLNKSVERGGESFPGGPNDYAPGRWNAYYESVSGTTAGTFFGVMNRPDESVKANYLFMAFFGSYNNDFILNEPNTAGYYLVRSKANGEYKFWRVAGPINSTNWGDSTVGPSDPTKAVQVICVK